VLYSKEVINIKIYVLFNKFKSQTSLVWLQHYGRHAIIIHIIPHLCKNHVISYKLENIVFRMLLNFKYLNLSFVGTIVKN